MFGSASDKEKHIAVPHVTSMTAGTKDSGKKVSLKESILEDADVYDERSKVTHHELLLKKHEYHSKAVESGEESKIDEETIQAAEAEMDEFTPKIVDFNKELKIFKHSENDSEENNWAAAEEFLALVC